MNTRYIFDCDFFYFQECLRNHERDMEHSFAVARSREKTCGICMETVLDKPHGEAR